MVGMCQSDLKMTSLDGRGRRQHREEVDVVDDVAAASQLGRVGNDAAVRPRTSDLLPTGSVLISSRTVNANGTSPRYDASLFASSSH